MITYNHKIYYTMSIYSKLINYTRNQTKCITLLELLFLVNFLLIPRSSPS